MLFGMFAFELSRGGRLLARKTAPGANDRGLFPIFPPGALGLVRTLNPIYERAGGVGELAAGG
jgi:hypothetical protein